MLISANPNADAGPSDGMPPMDPSATMEGGDATTDMDPPADWDSIDTSALTEEELIALRNAEESKDEFMPNSGEGMEDAKFDGMDDGTMMDGGMEDAKFEDGGIESGDFNSTAINMENPDWNNTMDANLTLIDENLEPPPIIGGMNTTNPEDAKEMVDPAEEDEEAKVCSNQAIYNDYYAELANRTDYVYLNPTYNDITVYHNYYDSDYGTYTNAGYYDEYYKTYNCAELESEMAPVETTEPEVEDPCGSPAIYDDYYSQLAADVEYVYMASTYNDITVYHNYYDALKDRYTNAGYYDEYFKTYSCNAEAENAPTMNVTEPEPEGPCPNPHTYDDYYSGLASELEYMYLNPTYNDITVYHNYYDPNTDRYTNGGYYDEYFKTYTCNEDAPDAPVVNVTEPEPEAPCPNPHTYDDYYSGLASELEYMYLNPTYNDITVYHNYYDAANDRYTNGGYYDEYFKTYQCNEEAPDAPTMNETEPEPEAPCPNPHTYDDYYSGLAAELEYMYLNPTYNDITVYHNYYDAANDRYTNGGYYDEYFKTYSCNEDAPDAPVVNVTEPEPEEPCPNPHTYDDYYSGLAAELEYMYLNPTYNDITVYHNYYDAANDRYTNGGYYDEYFKTYQCNEEAPDAPVVNETEPEPEAPCPNPHTYDDYYSGLAAELEYMYLNPTYNDITVYHNYYDAANDRYTNGGYYDEYFKTYQCNEEAPDAPTMNETEPEPEEPCPNPHTYDDYYSGLAAELEYMYLNPTYNDITVYHNYYDASNDRYTNGGYYDEYFKTYTCNEDAPDAPTMNETEPEPEEPCSNQHTYDDYYSGLATDLEYMYLNPTYNDITVYHNYYDAANDRYTNGGYYDEYFKTYTCNEDAPDAPVVNETEPEPEGPCPNPHSYDDYYSNLAGEVEYVYLNSYYNDVTVYHNYYDRENDIYTNGGYYDEYYKAYTCNENAEDAPSNN